VPTRKWDFWCRKRQKRAVKFSNRKEGRRQPDNDCAEQQLHRTTIEQLHNLPLLPSPSLLIVGKIAALAVPEVPANGDLREELVATQGDAETATTLAAFGQGL